MDRYQTMEVGWCIPSQNLSYLTFSRTERNPPWTQACGWNDLLLQWLTTNKGLPGYCRLTRPNTTDHANGPIAAHYFSMHIARLLCQIFLHWEFLPFLPLRFKQAEGLPSSHSLYRQAHEAPPGFWKSSARECFGAARSILALTADAREARSLTATSFALYGIFVAKFIEAYAKAFPWMNPDCYGNGGTPSRDECAQCRTYSHMPFL